LRRTVAANIQKKKKGKGRKYERKEILKKREHDEEGIEMKEIVCR
jgi:stalled ribosome alternative rescue factor ArfA